MKTKFERVSLLPPYVFAEINDLKAKERLKGRDVIDLGMGNPDNSTPKHIVDKLIETIKNGKTHRYSVSKGILGCLLYTSPSPRDKRQSRMPSSA